MPSSRRILVGIIAAFATMAVVASLGCSAGASYNLNRDKSLSTEWGTVLQFKVDEKWTESEFANSDEYFASTSYTDGTKDKPADNSVSIHVTNPKSSTYKYSSTSTYGDWLDYEEEYYTRSPEDQAKWYRENMGSYLKENPEQGEADYYPTYSDTAITEIGSQTVAGNDFRIYKLKYTITYSDSRYNQLKEKNSNFKKSSTNEYYYGILKDGSHDLEVSASSEKLLKDFLATFEIKW